MFTFESDSQNFDNRIDSFFFFILEEKSSYSKYLCSEELSNPISTAYKVEMNNLTRKVVYRSWWTVQTLIFMASSSLGSIGPARF